MRFLDEHMVVVSKPSGLLVHRDRNFPDGAAALQLVRDQTGRYLFPVHRLDRATSGMLMFAFSKEMAAALQENLRSAYKRYCALVRYPGSGASLGSRWVCERPLRDEKEVPREARTEFALVEAFDRCGLVHALPTTGRYHQIRRHLNHCGRHVIGDTSHGKGKINRFFRARYGLHRLFLHLEVLCIDHPESGLRLELHDPLAAELSCVLRRLRERDTESDSSGCVKAP